MTIIKRPTEVVYIEGDHYCAYCGERARSIQDRILAYNDYAVTGHYCECEGAKSELEYKEKELELKSKYEQDLSSLQAEYRSKLKLCTRKLFDIKQRRERQRFDVNDDDDRWFDSYFSTVNGTPKTQVMFD